MTRLARVLDSDMRELRRLHPIEQSVDDRVTPLSTASLTLSQGEYAAFHDWVEVFTQNGSAGVYRVSSASETYTDEASVELEHGICVLGDSIIPGKGTMIGTVAQVLGAMLDFQVTADERAPLWALGEVQTEAQAICDYDGTNLLSAVISVVPDGYMLTFDQSTLPWRIGVAEMETVPSCEGRLSRNLRGVTVTVDDEDFCTRIYCDKLPEPGYMDGPTAGRWGVIAKTITAQDNVTQESLIGYITQYLEDHKNPRVSIECDAEDLSAITGETIDRLEKGRLFRIALPDYGVAMEERILAVRTGSAYDEPERVRLTLANSIRDTADTLVYIDNVVTGGASSARGGYLRGGAGISPANVLDMLKKTETYITADEAWTREAGIKIESNYAEIYATKKAIVGDWTGDVETINALIHASTDNGGLVSMIAGRHNSAEDINAIISATSEGGGLVKLKASQEEMDAVGERVSAAEATIEVHSRDIELKVDADGVISAINLSPEEVVISSNRINLSGYVTASQLEAEIANIKITDSSYVTTASLSTKALDANYGEFTVLQTNTLRVLGSTLSFNGKNLGIGSTKVVISVTGKTVAQVALYDPNGEIYAYAIAKYEVKPKTATINYIGWAEEEGND